MRAGVLVVVASVAAVGLWMKLGSNSGGGSRSEPSSPSDSSNNSRNRQRSRDFDSDSTRRLEYLEPPAVQSPSPPRPGEAVRSVLGHEYAGAEDEHRAITEAVRETGSTDAAWSLDATDRIHRWTTRWPPGVELRGVACFVEGCLAQVYAPNRDALGTGAALVPREAEENWVGGTLQLAPFEDEYGATVTSLLLLNPAAAR